MSGSRRIVAVLYKADGTSKQSSYWIGLRVEMRVDVSLIALCFSLVPPSDRCGCYHRSALSKGSQPSWHGNSHGYERQDKYQIPLFRHVSSAIASCKPIPKSDPNIVQLWHNLAFLVRVSSPCSTVLPQIMLCSWYTRHPCHH